MIKTQIIPILIDLKKLCQMKDIKWIYQRAYLLTSQSYYGQTVGLPIYYYKWHYYLFSPFWAFILNTVVVLLLTHVNIIGMMMYNSLQT